MARFQGKRVSRSWNYILNAAVRDGVRFILNDGKRTMAEQRQRVRDHGAFSASNPTGAAAPSPTAPHIMRGHENHALDVNTLDGGEQRLQNWLRAHGLNAVNNVITEAWHLFVTDEADLIALAKRLHKRRSLILEMKHLRAVVRTRFHGKWRRAPKRRRRVKAIQKWLRRHRGRV